MRANYSKLKQWIKTNPEVRSLNRLALSVGESEQRLFYSVKNGSFMNDKVVDKIVEKYNLTEEQKNEFFYTRVVNGKTK